MSNPVKKAATPSNDGGSEVDVSQEVSNLVKEIKVDEEGNYVFPEDKELSPELKFAATAEKRRRDTQSEFTKSAQSNKALQAQNEKLMELLTSKTNVSLSEDQKEELEDLKLTDPEAWRKKLNQYESEALAKQQEELSGLTGEAKKAAEVQFELDRRERVLEVFNESAKVPITDEVLANDVPPRITNKLNEGKISFEEFLEEVDGYLNKGKTVKKEDTLDQPNLGDMGGGPTPQDMKPEKGLSASYSGDIY